MTEGEGAPHGSEKTADLRRLEAQVFVSMDGVLQGPGGPDEDRDGGFRHGGWAMTHWDDSMGRAMGEFASRPHELLLGRRTYDLFAAYWPNHREAPVAASLNGAVKHVASRTKRSLAWENSKLLPGDLVPAVLELKRRPGPRLRVLGSANLLQTLLGHDLVDELYLWVFPVVIGTGKRLFQDGTRPTAWKLTRSMSSGTGVLLQNYERAGEITYGHPPGT